MRLTVRLPSPEYQYTEGGGRRHHEWLLGYTAAIDLAARDINLLGGNFLHLCRGKGFDTFCPVGPTIQTEGDFDSVAIKLSVDGKTRQDSRSDDMIFSDECMVSFYSQVMTLVPGHLILTGGLLWITMANFLASEAAA
jgi:2-keto-4-pentenoate hydratase/2-oxohepta-3-ene-1,7-dioic acid hydratase in catechol pathway